MKIDYQSLTISRDTMREIGTKLVKIRIQVPIISNVLPTGLPILMGKSR